MKNTAWLNSALDLLAQQPAWGYRATSTQATEPTALACLALAAHGRGAAAARMAAWLAERQDSEGRLGMTVDEASPHWPTALAVIAWRRVGGYDSSIERAIAALLQLSGRVVEKLEAMGHDPTIVAWSWVADTHAWLEPTAWCVLALQAAGRRDHERAREGVRMIVDRLLPGGGCNYGNTLVLGQELRPHLQPSGLALVALANEQLNDPRVARTVDYVAAAVATERATASLAYGVLGLTALGKRPPTADDWLALAAARVLQGDKSPHRLALACLAAADCCPLLATLPETPR